MRPATIAAVLALFVTACGGKDDAGGDAAVAAPVATAPVQATSPGQAPMAMGTMPHGDHNPHHGGIVMMKGDLHFEVVSNAAGRYNLYFTDATRADLPAAVAQDVALTVHRPNAPDEPVAMRIDDSGESWTGTGTKVDTPADASVRVAFTIKGEQPYWIDLPYVAPAPVVPPKTP